MEYQTVSVTCDFFKNSSLVQTDMVTILPFDLLCLHFEFSSIYRLNRLIRVGNRLLIFTLGVYVKICPQKKDYIFVLIDFTLFCLCPRVF